MAKTGADHAKSVRDGREVYFNAERVHDVTSHPAFRNAVRTICSIYDYQSAPENMERLTFESPRNRRRVGRAWQLTRSYQELVSRRAALMEVLRLHFGFMGRSPDVVASGIAGMMMGIDVLEEIDSKRAASIRNYYEYARDEDLFTSYAVVNPQGDRSKGVSDQGDEFHSAGVVDEDSGGITIRGGKMLGTASIMSNEVFVGNVQPLRPGEERYAVAFAIPMATKGLKIFSRKSYEYEALSDFDNPLSSRLDENDAVFYFDDVRVPWDRVFAYRDIRLSRDIFHGTHGHLFHNYQAQMRLAVKLQFLLAVAKRITEVNSTGDFPQVRETLGKLAAQASMVEGLVYAMEAAGQMRGEYYIPARQFLYSALCMTQTLYHGFVNDIRELAGGGLIMLPSCVDDFAHPDINPFIAKTQRSAVTDAEGRVRFFKLAWDALGSEFASRHAQYEMFYVGPTFVARNYMLNNYPWKQATGMLESVLDSYDAQSVLEKRGQRKDHASKA
jgi:4-hydroxyphenylacetate 3-monooxygenase